MADTILTKNGDLKLNFYQGDDVDFEVVLQDDQEPPVPIDLTGASFECIMKEEFTSTTIFPFTVVNTDLPNGKINLIMSATQTSTLPITGTKARKSFVFDLKVTYAGGLVETPLFGNIIVDRNRS